MEKLKLLKSTRSGTLFALTAPFRLAEVGTADAHRWSDDLLILRELIISNEEMYPSIRRWFSDKVIPGLKSSERVAYLAYENDRPIGAAILKLGSNTKICHVCIHEDFRDLDLGQIVFTQLVLRSRKHANRIHFTLPEGLWSSRAGFFESFGFLSAEKSRRQYRRSETELSCSAPMARVWSAILKKLPNLVRKFMPDRGLQKNELLMSIKPTYAQRILGNKKRVEIRKKFSAKWIGSRAILYSTRPVSALVGEASIDSVCSGKPEDVWSVYSPYIDCSRAEYQSYVGASSEVYAIEFGDVMSYPVPVPISELSRLMGYGLRPPQSFFSLAGGGENSWAVATWIAGALGSFSTSSMREHINE